MRITRIQARGVKLAAGRTVPLSKMTLFLGDHGTGKSAAMSAVRLGAVGFEPALGRANEQTARLMAGEEMGVELNFDDGSAATRTWRRRRGSVQGDATASWQPTGTATEAGEAIRTRFGASDDEVAEVLDLREFLNASASERARRIDAILDATSSVRDPDASLEALILARLAGQDESRIPSQPDDMALWIRATRATTTADHLGAIDQNPVRARLKERGAADALVLAGEWKRELDQSLRTKRAARQELEDRVRAMATPAGRLVDLKEAHAVAIGSIGTLTERIRAARLARDGMAKTRAALEDAEIEFGKAREKEATLEQIVVDLQETERRKAALVRPQQGAIPAEPERQEVADRVAELVAQAEVHEDHAAGTAVAYVREPAAPATPTPEVYEDLLKNARRRVDDARAEPWRKVGELATTIHDHPNVGPAVMGAAAGIRLIAANQATPLDKLVEELRRVERGSKEAETVWGAYREAVAKAKAANNVADKAAERAASLAADARKCRNEADALTRAERDRRARVERETKAAADTKFLHDLDAFQREAARLDGIAANLRKERDAIASRAAGAGTKLRALRETIAASHVQTAEALVADEGALATTVAARDDLAQRIRAFESLDACTREMHAITAAIAACEAGSEVARASEWALQTLRSRDLGARGAPLLDRIQRFLVAAGLPVEPYLKADKRTVDFGWVRDGKPVHVSAMGGGDAVLFQTALAAAIIALRKAPVRVVLVEAAEAGRAWLTSALQRGLAAVQDGFDNAIVSTCSETAKPEEGWVAIDMGAQS